MNIVRLRRRKWHCSKKMGPQNDIQRGTWTLNIVLEASGAGQSVYTVVCRLGILYPGGITLL